MERATHPGVRADIDIVEATSSNTPDLEQSIADNAAGPRRAQGDSGSVEQHSLTDQIEADRYLASKAASKRPDRGLRMSRIAPPGAGEMA
ncbi:MAG: hypothetical protein AB7R63_13140 [Phycisphaerales bacterium]